MSTPVGSDLPQAIASATEVPGDRLVAIDLIAHDKLPVRLPRQRARSVLAGPKAGHHHAAAPERAVELSAGGVASEDPIRVGRVRRAVREPGHDDSAVRLNEHGVGQAAARREIRERAPLS
jgi:hypothetical protein